MLNTQKKIHFYFFIQPHPYFRQNALLKWKGKDYNNKSGDSAWDVGRVVDFDEENDIIYIQNTFRCGTKDDEAENLFPIRNWSEWVDKTDATFIKHSHLYQLKQQILYWWDRPGIIFKHSQTIKLFRKIIPYNSVKHIFLLCLIFFL